MSSWSSRSQARRKSAHGFIRPALPVLATVAPQGPEWLYAIKHDGYRLIIRKDGSGHHLWSRNGRDWSAEFKAISAAVTVWKLRSFVIDGEACAHRPDGLPDFHALLGGGQGCASACFHAFDLLALDGVDLRHLPFSERYAKLARMLAGAPEAINLCEHTDEFDGAAMFEHACRLGLEGIVAKRRSSRYRSGRCASWVKIKNASYSRG